MKMSKTGNLTLHLQLSQLLIRLTENTFFQSHDVFRSCDPRVWGIDQLAKRLSALLMTRIQLQLVPMRSHVELSLGILDHNDSSRL